MVYMRVSRGGAAGCGLLFGLGVFGSSPALAQEEEPSCRVIEFEMTPSSDLQIVVWIEDESGTYVDTAFITRLTGTHGLGNRPGMMTFNSGPAWPYGRRISTFPVWAGRHGLDWPMVVFQNSDDMNLSHPLAQSSVEPFYCRPVRENESLWDAATCATTVYTDKGVLADSMRSPYPPRSDLTRVAGIDHASVTRMANLNPFDIVSKATPAGDQKFAINWAIPDGMPNGNYVALIEVNSEFDQNASYAYPEPVGIPWQDYGEPYRGHPSVIYRVPFTLSNDEFSGSTLDYAGYGDPDGIDSMIREPDDTITSGTPGSGAGRLLVTVDGEEMYRVRVNSRPAFDDLVPGGAGEFRAMDVTTTSITASFIAPGDDDQDGGTVTGYEVRYLAGTEIDDDNFTTGTPAAVQIVPLEPGTVHAFTITDLLPNTNYYIGVRAFDECLNKGPVEVLHVLTPQPETGEVDACFVATAAYGSLLANDVQVLRRFRDVALRSHVTGELLVEAYYTFGPLFAKLIEPSETLRRAARGALGPAVGAARSVVGSP
jgi:hypothetical protein